MSGVSKVKVFVERADNRPWKYVTLEIPNHILKDDNLLYEAIEARLIDTLQEPFGGWDLISTEEIKSFESTPYNNYYGACMTSEGCFETSLETCRAIGGRFQGPGTSCGGYQPPVMMRSETTETTGKVNSVMLAITVGVMTGVATTIFGNILSEMWLDRLREDPELHTTPDDLDEPV